MTHWKFGTEDAAYSCEIMFWGRVNETTSSQEPEDVWIYVPSLTKLIPYKSQEHKACLHRPIKVLIFASFTTENRTKSTNTLAVAFHPKQTPCQFPKVPELRYSIHVICSCGVPPPGGSRNDALWQWNPNSHRLRISAISTDGSIWNKRKYGKTDGKKEVIPNIYSIIDNEW